MRKNENKYIKFGRHWVISPTFKKKIVLIDQLRGTENCILLISLPWKIFDWLHFTHMPSMLKVHFVITTVIFPVERFVQGNLCIVYSLWAEKFLWCIWPIITHLLTSHLVFVLWTEEIAQQLLSFPHPEYGKLMLNLWLTSQQMYGALWYGYLNQSHSLIHFVSLGFFFLNILIFVLLCCIL